MSRVFSLPVLALSLIVAGPALGQSGVIEINQAQALAGGVTPGDEAGFPVKIFASGSYILTGDLTVPDTNTSAIELHAVAFNLNLNGFSISGPGTCSGCPVTSCTGGSGRGVYTVAPATVELRNGAIRGMGAEGVVVDGGLILVDVRIRDNGGRGVNAFGLADSRIQRVEAVANGDEGLRAVGSTRLTDSSASCNAGGGIEVGFSSLVVGNIVTDNGGGIFANGGSTVSDNTSRNNGGAGISVAGGSTASRNTVSNNTVEGIFAVDGSYVQGNLVYSNGSTGIKLAGTTGGVFGNILSSNGASLSSGRALSLGAQVGYSDNVLSSHGASPSCTAVTGGVEMGQNMCDGVASCVASYCVPFKAVCGLCIP